MNWHLTFRTTMLAAIAGAVTAFPASAQVGSGDWPSERPERTAAEYERDDDRDWNGDDEEWYDPADWGDNPEVQWYDPRDWFRDTGDDDDRRFAREDRRVTRDYDYDRSRRQAMDRRDAYDRGRRGDDPAARREMREQRQQQRYTADWDDYRGADWGRHRPDRSEYRGYGYDLYNEDRAPGERAGMRGERPQRERARVHSVRGEIVGIERIQASQGRPEAVRLRVRTDSGETRTVLLGDRESVDRDLPNLREGEQVFIRGDRMQRDGRPMFRARQIRMNEDEFTIPEYRFDETIEAELVGVRQARVRDGEVEAVIARVRTEDGDTHDVYLGTPEDVRRQGSVLRENSRVEIQGWTRAQNGREVFNVENVRVLRQPGERQTAEERQEFARDEWRDR